MHANGGCCNSSLSYIASVEENDAAAVAPAAPSVPEPEYVVGGRVDESKEPSLDRFDLLMQVAAPFSALPLTKENIKAVKTAFILKNSEQVRHSRFPLPSTDEIRRAVGVVRVRIVTPFA